MKHLAIFLALGIYGTAFSAEYLASIDHDADLSTLPVNSVLQFTKDVKFKYGVDSSEFSKIQNGYKTSRGYNIFCRLYIKKRIQDIEPLITLPADTHAKITKVNLRKNASENFGNTYRLELDAETPDGTLPLYLNCLRYNDQIEKKNEVPLDATIQEFLDVGKDTFQLIELGEAVKEATKEQAKKETPDLIQQQIEPKPQEIPVVVQEPKVEVKIEPKVEVKPTLVAPVVVKKLKVECDYKDENSNQKIYLDTQVDPSGYTTATGYKNDVSVKLTYNRQRPSDGREIIVSFDGYNLNKSLRPGLGSISFETGMVTKMLGIKRKLKVECFPERERLVQE